jgi:hypothetical protein
LNLCGGVEPAIHPRVGDDTDEIRERRKLVCRRVADSDQQGPFVCNEREWKYSRDGSKNRVER